MPALAFFDPAPCCTEGGGEGVGDDDDEGVNTPDMATSVYVLKSTVKVPEVMFARRASAAAAPGASRATAMLPGRACTCSTSSESTCITLAAVTRIASCRSAMGAVCGTVSTVARSSGNANDTAIPGWHCGCVYGSAL